MAGKTIIERAVYIPKSSNTEQKSLTIQEFLEFSKEIEGLIYMTSMDNALFITYKNGDDIYSVLVPDISLEELKGYVSDCNAGMFVPDAISKELL